MAFNYTPSKYRANQLLSSLIACIGAQFFSLAAGLWWLFLIVGLVMVIVYRKPELNTRKGLGVAIVVAQVANFFGGLAFLTFPNYRPVIILSTGAVCLIFSMRIILRINKEINSQRAPLNRA